MCFDIREDDMPLLKGKLEVVGHLLHSTNSERRFERVITVLDLPEPVLGETRVNAERLLKLRESDECRCFRDWLAGTESLSDAELSKRLQGISARIREAVNSKWGKRLRFVVSNGLSMVPPPVGVAVGLAASAVDAFILERLAPKDGVVSFLSESYPSLFNRKP